MNQTDTDHSEGRLTVLYVEDEPINVLMMQALFGYRPMLRLVTATTGEAALKLAATSKPVLLLLDIHLPDCKGDDLLNDFRKVSACRDSPAIAVTSDKSFKIRGTGFCEVWYKPFLLFHTLERIDKRLLPRRGQTQRPIQRLMVATG